MWSVDANVSLFGIKFTILFSICLILFLVLVPFNVILLFTRTLSRSHFINKFKPLLDAYQGPYKVRFYYWTGLQLLIRAVFFGISALDKSANLTIGSIVLSVMIGLQGVINPFKSSIKNYQELFYITNLQILYILTLSDYLGDTTVNTMVTLAVIFMYAYQYTTLRYVDFVTSYIYSLHIFTLVTVNIMKTVCNECISFSLYFCFPFCLAILYASFLN